MSRHTRREKKPGESEQAADSLFLHLDACGCPPPLPERSIPTALNIIMGIGLFYPGKEDLSLFFGWNNGSALLRIRLGLNREILFLRFSDFIRNAAIIGHLAEDF
jgi:hypothetical protein